MANRFCNLLAAPRPAARQFPLPDVRCTFAATQDSKILRGASGWRILAREGEMRNRPARLLFHIMIAALLLCSLVACKKSGRSSGIKCAENCASYQHTDSLPEQPPQGTIRLAIGGDSRDDRSGVVPWAFKEAPRRCAKALFFLGDLELTPAEDELFLRKLNDLSGVPFYPGIANHAVERL